MIGKLLDHDKIETTPRYAHPAWDSIVASSARVAGSIGAGILDRPPAPCDRGGLTGGAAPSGSAPAGRPPTGAETGARFGHAAGFGAVARIWRNFFWGTFDAGSSSGTPGV